MILIVLSIIAVVFAAIWSYRAWKVPGGAAAAIVGGILVFFVPFGTVIAIVGAVILVGVAQKAKFARVAAGDED